MERRRTVAARDGTHRAPELQGTPGDQGSRGQGAAEAGITKSLWLERAILATLKTQECDSRCVAPSASSASCAA